MTWTQFNVVSTRGGRTTLGMKVRLEVVECWVGGLVAVLDRDTLTTWLAAPDGPLTRDEVTFEPDADGPGLVVSFEGRVARTVLGPEDVARLAAAVCRELPLVDVSSAFKSVRVATSTSGSPSAGTGPSVGGAS